MNLRSHGYIYLWSFFLIGLGSYLAFLPKPGIPIAMKSDEPAYFLAAVSLVKDFDIRFDEVDLERGFKYFPFTPINNLILASDDGWETVYYGKPFLYSFCAAPFVALLGANGILFFNFILFMGMILCGGIWLSQFLDRNIAFLLSFLFFSFSNLAAYVTWMHPEVFMASSLFFSLLILIWKKDSNLFLFLSGAILAMGTYHKPMLVAFILVPFALALSMKKAKIVILWLIGFTSSLILWCSLSILFMGHPNAYLGLDRAGYKFDTSDDYEKAFSSVREEYKKSLVPKKGESEGEHKRTPKNSWEWLLFVPSFPLSLFGENLKYFFLGRHTGMVVYMPFAVAAVLTFVFSKNKNFWKLAVLVSILSVALFFLIWLYFNWHGGGGFIGNRYFVIVYPAFFFLISDSRYTLPLLGSAAIWSALFAFHYLLHPFGIPVHRPTLQYHVRSPIFQFFPLELTMLDRIPGYHGQKFKDLWFLGRKDQLLFSREEIHLFGTAKSELYLYSEKKLKKLGFLVYTPKVPNKVYFKVGKKKEVSLLHPRHTMVTIESPEVYKILVNNTYVYKLIIKADRAGFVPDFNGYLGVTIVPVTNYGILDKDIFAIKWISVSLPTVLSRETDIEVEVRVANLSRYTWPGSGNPNVKIGCWWKKDKLRVGEVFRGALPSDLPSGRRKAVVLNVITPKDPGEYLFVCDALLEYISWFSHKGASRIETEVTVE